MGAQPSRFRRAANWCFRNRRTGRITVGQWPNLPLVLFGVFSVSDRLLRPAGEFGAALRLGASLTLGWWAADELLRGVNPWRRALGTGVLAYLAIVSTAAWMTRW